MSPSTLESPADPIRQLGLPLTRLRALLLRELDAQTKNAAESRATAASLAGQSDTDSLLEREVAEATTLRAEDALAEVERALTRIDDGTYGSCESCGSAIAVERLEAIPHARQCVDCSRQRAVLFG
jgi:DnaK suppressor protein